MGKARSSAPPKSISLSWLTTENSRNSNGEQRECVRANENEKSQSRMRRGAWALIMCHAAIPWKTRRPPINLHSRCAIAFPHSNQLIKDHPEHTWVASFPRVQHALWNIKITEIECAAPLPLEREKKHVYANAWAKLWRAPRAPAREWNEKNDKAFAEVIAAPRHVNTSKKFPNDICVGKKVKCYSIGPRRFVSI